MRTIFAVLALAAALLPSTALASRAPSRADQSGIMRAARAELGAKVAECAARTDRIRVSTVTPAYALYEWRGTPHKVCEQGAGFMLHKLRGRWGVMKLYLPTDTYCGTALERVYLDLLAGCWVDENPDTFPLAIAKAPGAGATRCGEYLDADQTNTLHVGVYLLRNMGPHKVTCAAAKQFAVSPPQRDADTTTWWESEPIDGMSWSALWSRYDGTVVIARHVDSTEPLPTDTTS